MSAQMETGGLMTIIPCGPLTISIAKGILPVLISDESKGKSC